MRLGLGDAAALQQRVGQGAGRVGQFFASQLLDIDQGTLNALVSFFVALYVAFFMLRDGSTLAAAIGHAMPLRRADKNELGRTFATVVRATVKGNLVVALVQARSAASRWRCSASRVRFCSARRCASPRCCRASVRR